MYRKLAATPVGDGMGWQFVNDLYRIRGDRFLANVRLDFRDQVKTAVKGERFLEADGGLHHPPTGYTLSDSFKTTENYGNLQLTFFASTASVLLAK